MKVISEQEMVGMLKDHIGAMEEYKFCESVIDAAGKLSRPITGNEVADPRATIVKLAYLAATLRVHLEECSSYVRALKHAYAEELISRHPL